jgi:hypothetical protein
MPSRLDDPPQKIGFADDRWLLAPGGGGAAEATDEAIYLGIALRNAGTGIAVLHGWNLYPRRLRGEDGHAPPEEFRRLLRDLYIPVNDLGFWQGVFRDPSAPEFAGTRAAIEARETLTIDILYGDYEGGQRTITRFALLPRENEGWLAVAARHWNLDRPDPR